MAMNESGEERATMESTPEPTQKEGGRMDRIADQTKGLVDDVKEWVDLKVQLVQLEVEEKFETVANQLLTTFLVLILLLITLIFALIAASLGIGKLLGDPLWGFLAVTGLLAITTLVAYIVKPRFVSAPWKGSKTDEKALKAEVPAPQLPQKAESTLKSHIDGSGIEEK